MCAGAIIIVFGSALPGLLEWSAWPCPSTPVNRGVCGYVPIHKCCRPWLSLSTGVECVALPIHSSRQWSVWLRAHPPMFLYQ